MTTHICTLLTNKDLSEVSRLLKISRRKLDKIISGQDLISTTQAVTLGDYLGVSPKVILDKQTDEQLAKLEVKKEPSAKPPRTPSTRSPAGSLLKVASKIQRSQLID